MRISKEDQIRSLAPLLKAAGFKKKAGNWHRATSDGVHVVNIQGSQWGDDYYLNVGFYLSALGQESTPPSYRCHVQSRLVPPDGEATDLCKQIESWLSENGSVAVLSEKQVTGKLPLVISGAATEFLVQHNHSLQARRP